MSQVECVSSVLKVKYKAYSYVNRKLLILDRKPFLSGLRICGRVTGNVVAEMIARTSQVQDTEMGRYL